MMGRPSTGSGKGKRGATSPPGGAADLELTEDQRYSLAEQHRGTYVRLEAAKKKADKDLKDFGKIVKADLGEGGLKQIKAIIEGKTPEGEAEIKARIERDMQVLRWLGVPIGTQTDLFPKNDRAPLKDRAFAEGKRQGLAGETLHNPHHVTTEAHRFHNDGYAEGQSILGAGFKKADNTPKGSQPSLAEMNKQAQNAIKTGTVDQLGTKPSDFKVN